MSDGIINQIDKGLQRYYKQLNANYIDADSGNNKFIAYCEDNQFDDDAVIEELKTNPKDSMVVDFDEDFPFAKDKNPKNRSKAIFDIIMRCYKIESAYSGQPRIKIEKEHFHFDEKELDIITHKYERYADAIFEKANAGGDQALHKILDISDNIKKIDQPYLRLLADLYARDRIKYNFLIPKIREQFKDEISKLLKRDQNNITVKQLTERTWANLNDHTKTIKNWNTQHEEFDLLISALISFYFRVCNLRDSNCCFKIDDEYMTICDYISDAVDFVYNIAHNQPICPFQFDFCIAFNNVKCHESKVRANQKQDEKQDQKDNYSDDDDDDDDIDNSKVEPPKDLIFNGDQNLYDVVEKFAIWAEKKKIHETNWLKIWRTYIIKGEDIEKKVKENCNNINTFDELIQYLGGYFDCFGNIIQRLKDENMCFITENIKDTQQGEHIRFNTPYDKLCEKMKKKLPIDEEIRKKELDSNNLLFKPKKQRYEQLKEKYDLIHKTDGEYKKIKDKYEKINDKKMKELLKSVDEYKKDKKQFDKYTKELAEEQCKKKEEQNRSLIEKLEKQFEPYKTKFDEGIYGKENKELVYLRQLLREIKELEIQKCNDKEINGYPRRFRFVSVLDRREENKENESIENDELIFFEAHRNSFKLPPEEMKCDDLWYFHSSKKCIIPKCKKYIENDKNKKRQLQTKVINTDHAMKHGMLLFSFHVDAFDEIRCYLYYGSQMVRFLPEDLKLYLPLFFDEPTINDEHLNLVIENIKSKLIDEKFKAFYSEYKAKDEIMQRDITNKMKAIIEQKKKDKREWIKRNYERIQNYSDLYARDLIDSYYKNNKQLSLEQWASLVTLKNESQVLINEVTNFYGKCKLLKPGLKNIQINYDYKLIYKHIYDAIIFVYKLSKTHNKPCPFQYDCCFIFDTENDYFGDIKNRLKKAQLIYESKIINKSFMGKLKDKNNLPFQQLYDKFVEKVRKEEQNSHYPRRFRFLSVFDGRKRNKNENELIFFGSSKESYKISYTDDKCEGEWYFQQTCIIPNDEKENDNNEINICNPSINNGMLVLSFHVEGCDDNRCYLYAGGKMVKMSPKDLNTFLPELFINNTSNVSELEKLTTDIVKNHKLYHKKLSTFAKYNNYEKLLKESNEKKNDK